MKLHLLPKTLSKSKKRLGQGYGSGKGGHTSSRGQKGQKSRGSIRLSFTGSSWVWFKRLPFVRGKARFNSLTKTSLITLTDLNKFKAGSVITPELLHAHGLSGKIVATGSLTKKLTVQVPATRTAAIAIEKAGGSYSVKAK